jgi:hypothetical protein
MGAGGGHGTADDTIELQNGCACCSSADELAESIEKLMVAQMHTIHTHTETHNREGARERRQEGEQKERERERLRVL